MTTPQMDLEQLDEQWLMERDDWPEDFAQTWQFSGKRPSRDRLREKDYEEEPFGWSPFIEIGNEPCDLFPEDPIYRNGAPLGEIEACIGDEIERADILRRECPETGAEITLDYEVTWQACYRKLSDV